MMDKMISANALKKKIYDHPTRRSITKDKVIQYINELPSVQPEQRWIPCSDRLPEEHEMVLIYDSAFNIITFDSIHNGKWLKHPVAWLPIPKPYKEKKDER